MAKIDAEGNYTGLDMYERGWDKFDKVTKDRRAVNLKKAGKR